MLSFILCVLLGVLVGYVSVAAASALTLNPVNLGSSGDKRVTTTLFVVGTILTIACCVISGFISGLAALIGIALAGAYWSLKLY